MTDYATYKAEPVDAQVNWGSCQDPRGVLTVGETYEVEKIVVHSWHTKIFLKDYPGKGFNEVSFTYDSEIVNHYPQRRNDW